MADKPEDLLAVLKEAIAAFDLSKVEKASAELVKSIETAGPQETDELVVSLDQAVAVGNAERVRRLTSEFTAQLRASPAVYPKTFVKVLEEAVNSFDRQQVGKLCAGLSQHLRVMQEAYPLDEAKKVLDLLRRKRYFEPMMQVAEVLIQTGQHSARIRRQYCQALIDSDQLVAGLEMLRALESSCEESDDVEELVQARGLIGRALKQTYMDAAKVSTPAPSIHENLADAIDAYYGVYKSQKAEIWHGINTVACVNRAEEDEVDLGDRHIDTDQIARDLQESIAAKDKRAEDKKDPKLAANLWDMATAAEACVALGDFKTALEWIVRYTGESGADAFEIASTLRQFEQVWRLDSSKHEQAKILQLLRAALLDREGGSVRIGDPGAEAATAVELANDPAYEAVLGTDRYRTYKWYVTGLERASGVAQIRDRSGNGHGTGFLVRGADVHESIADEWVLFTNAHVISEDPVEQAGVPSALPPDEAVVVFEAGPDPKREIEVGRILFTSPRSELDCSIVTLQGDVRFGKPFEIAKRLPLVTGSRRQRVYVIGHPRGGGLSFSIDDNLLLDHQIPKVHYRAPTEGGSSGSPVFNQTWQLIALHHAGGSAMKKLNNQAGTYPANEGLAVSSILQAVARQLS